MRTVLYCILLLIILTFIETNAQQIIPPGNWDKSWLMKPDVYRVLKQGEVGIVDSEGKILVPCQFDQVYDLTDDDYVRVLKDLKIGLYHLQKGLVLTAEYDQIWPFNKDIAKVLRNGKMGFVNRDGMTVIPVEFNHIWPEEAGLLKVLKDGKMGFFDLSGRLILPAEYQQIWSFEDGMARVLKDGKMGYVDREGNVVILPVYDQVWSFKNGIAKALQSGQILYIDKQGRVVDAPIQPEAPSVLPPDTIRKEVKQTTHVSGVRIGIDRVEIIDEGKTREIVIRPHKEKKRRNNDFEGHLAGINLGINSYLDSEGNENVPQEYSFMELNHGKSVEFSIFPFQHDIKLIGSRFGMVTSMGLRYNNYRFDISSPEDINEAGLTWFPDMPDDADITKSKLTILSIAVPLLFEVQLPDERRNREGLYLAGGVEGSMRLRSHTKVCYSSDGNNQKRKNKDDFDLKSFRYSFIARAGYRNFGIFGSYSPVSLFKNNKGPELYPYTIGVSFNFN